MVTAVGGMAGIGKTALAVHWADQVADRFPEGQLYVNLRGYEPTGEAAVDPADAVAGFLDALGVPPARVPPGLEARTALFRSIVADRRLLVLLLEELAAVQLVTEPAPDRWVLHGLGYAYHHLGDLDRATACYLEALGPLRDYGDEYGVALVELNLGDTLVASGDPAEARSVWAHAEQVFTGLERPEAERARAKLAALPGG